MNKTSAVKFSYGISGELPGGCVHHHPLTRAQFRQSFRKVIGRTEGKIDRMIWSNGSRKFDLPFVSSSFLPMRAYKNITLCIQVLP